MELQKFIDEKAIKLAKENIKKGDRIGCTRCPGTKRVFTFSHFDGSWMVSVSGISDFHPLNIYSINGVKISFRV